MYIVQIKGTNGSGKTTIAKQLIALSGDVEVIRNTVNFTYDLTVLHDLKWIIIGKYDPTKRMGGCDAISKVDAVKAAIIDAIEEYPQYYGILFEGMMLSTIKTTFYDYLLMLQADYAIEPRFIVLRTNIDSCIQRIRQRGSMRDMTREQYLKYRDNIRSKYVYIIHHTATYDQQYVRYIDVDEIERVSMVAAFLHAVPDDELFEQL